MTEGTSDDPYGDYWCGDCETHHYSGGEWPFQPWHELRRMDDEAWAVSSCVACDKTSWARKREQEWSRAADKQSAQLIRALEQIASGDRPDPATFAQSALVHIAPSCGFGGRVITECPVCGEALEDTAHPPESWPRRPGRW